MLELITDGVKKVLTDEELDYLADIYLKLKSNKTFRECSQTFQDFINDYLTEQAQEYLKRRQ